MKVVVDTSILIDYFRGGTAWQDFLKQAPQDAELFLPTVVIFELFSGKSTRNPYVAKGIDTLLKKLQHLDLTDEIARRAGILFRDTGKQMGPLDYIIASSALQIGGTVLTLNIKHFSQIQNLPIYQYL